MEQGDNLFALNKYQISSRIYTQLPYIDTVNFVRRYPDTLVIHVTAGTPAAWFESGGSCWLVDSRGKILESGDESLVSGRAQLLGLEPVNPTVGNTITVREEEQTRLERLTAFLSAIQARQMTGSLTSFIDLTADYELRFGYGDNLTVLFPMNGDFTQSTYYLQQTLWTMDERGHPPQRHPGSDLRGQRGPSAARAVAAGRRCGCGGDPGARDCGAHPGSGSGKHDGTRRER